MPRSGSGPKPSQSTIGLRNALPPWVLVWASATAVVFVLRAADILQSVPLCVFLSSIAGVLAYTVHVWRRFSAPTALTRFRQLILVLLVAVIPSLMDPSTNDVNNIPRLVVLVTAATVILGTWALDGFFGWHPRRLVNGLQWPLAGVLVWMGLTTITSVMPRTSLVGAYLSYDGLILIVSLAVVAGALAESFRLEQVPDLVRLYVAGSLPVLLYGLIQLHGVGRGWDFVPWRTGVITSVLSTFGNPNHFGGFLATILPMVVVDAAVLASHRWSRVALWIVAAVTVVLMIKTGARGAWLGTLFAVPVLAAVMWPRLRRWIRFIVPAGILVALGLVLFVVAVNLALSAAETRDERDVLTVVGAAPGAMARTNGYKAALLTVMGAVLAIPIGFLPIAVYVHGAPGVIPLEFPWRVAALLVIAIPLVGGLIVTAGSAAALRLRPVHISTMAYD